MIVYIASPYSLHADKQKAVNAQIDAFAILLVAGHEPVAPLLSHYVDHRYPTSYERWMRWCLAILSRCDAVLRLPGESAGADWEVAVAEGLGKPVYYQIDDVIQGHDAPALIVPQWTSFGEASALAIAFRDSCGCVAGCVGARDRAHCQMAILYDFLQTRAQTVARMKSMAKEQQ